MQIMRNPLIAAFLCFGAWALAGVAGCHSDPHDTHVRTALPPARL